MFLVWRGNILPHKTSIPVLSAPKAATGCSLNPDTFPACQSTRSWALPFAASPAEMLSRDIPRRQTSAKMLRAVILPFFSYPQVTFHTRLSWRFFNSSPPSSFKNLVNGLPYCSYSWKWYTENYELTALIQTAVACDYANLWRPIIFRELFNTIFKMPER